MRFNIADPRHGERLSDIIPLSARARSWLARVNAGIPEDESIQVVGAITMLEGLDYHYSRFEELVKRLGPYFTCRVAASSVNSGEFVQRLLPTATEIEDLNGLDHESVAYLNRLGQFHAFVNARGLASRLLKTHELMVFRNKHTAHRSIDAPRGENQYEREYQAMAFGFYRLTRDGFPTYQLPSGKMHHEFDMRRDHPLIMKEAIEILFTLYPFPNEA